MLEAAAAAIQIFDWYKKWLKTRNASGEDDAVLREKFLSEVMNLDEAIRYEQQRKDIENNTIWTREPIGSPENYHKRQSKSIPVVLVANLKGGVGKTTLAANMAGYFDARGKRVLLIDLDHQGSLSAMATGSDGEYEDEDEKPEITGVSVLLRGEEKTPPQTLRVVNSKSDSRIINSAPTFSSVEDYEQMEWLLGVSKDDVRFRIARYILSDAVQKNYDMVIMDGAPRVTVGLVNGIAACTQIIVPTLLEGASTRSLRHFFPFLKNFDNSLGLHLAPPLVVGCRKETQTERLIGGERDQVDYIKGRLKIHYPSVASSLFDLSASVPDKAAISKAAGRRIAYFTERDAQSAFAPLGEWLNSKLY